LEESISGTPRKDYLNYFTISRDSESASINRFGALISKIVSFGKTPKALEQYGQYQIKKFLDEFALKISDKY